MINFELTVRRTPKIQIAKYSSSSESILYTKNVDNFQRSNECQIKLIVIHLFNNSSNKQFVDSKTHKKVENSAFQFINQ